MIDLLANLALLGLSPVSRPTGRAGSDDDGVFEGLLDAALPEADVPMPGLADAQARLGETPEPVGFLESERRETPGDKASLAGSAAETPVQMGSSEGRSQVDARPSVVPGLMPPRDAFLGAQTSGPVETDIAGGQTIDGSVLHPPESTSEAPGWTGPSERTVPLPAGWSVLDGQNGAGQEPTFDGPGDTESPPLATPAETFVDAAPQSAPESSRAVRSPSPVPMSDGTPAPAFASSRADEGTPLTPMPTVDTTRLQPMHVESTPSQTGVPDPIGSDPSLDPNRGSGAVTAQPVAEMSRPSHVIGRPAQVSDPLVAPSPTPSMQARPIDSLAPDVAPHVARIQPQTPMPVADTPRPHLAQARPDSPIPHVRPSLAEARALVESAVEPWQTVSRSPIPQPRVEGRSQARPQQPVATQVRIQGADINGPTLEAQLMRHPSTPVSAATRDIHPASLGVMASRVPSAVASSIVSSVEFRSSGATSGPVADRSPSRRPTQRRPVAGSSPTSMDVADSRPIDEPFRTLDSAEPRVESPVSRGPVDADPAGPTMAVRRVRVEVDPSMAVEVSVRADGVEVAVDGTRDALEQMEALEPELRAALDEGVEALEQGRGGDLGDAWGDSDLRERSSLLSFELNERDDAEAGFEEHADFEGFSEDGDAEGRPDAGSAGTGRSNRGSEARGSSEEPAPRVARNWRGTRVDRSA